MTILSKGCKPDDLELHNSLRLSFTNIKALSSNFVDCESFLESKSPDIFALFETNLDGSIETVRGYLSLMDSTTHAWSHSLCEGRTSFCMGQISRKLCRFLLSTVFDRLDFTQCLTSFPLSITFVLFMHVFNSVSCNIDGVLSINPSADVFVFGDFNNHHKDWSAY